MIAAVEQAHAIQQFAGARGAVRAVAHQFQRQQHVLFGSERGDQVIGLKNEADGAPAQHRQPVFLQARDLFAGQADAAGGGRVEPRQQAQQRAFSAARRSHDGDELALRHIEIDALQDLDTPGSGSDGFGEAANLNHDRRRDSSSIMRTYFFAACLFLAACGDQPKAEAPAAQRCGRSPPRRAAGRAGRRSWLSATASPPDSGWTRDSVIPTFCRRNWIAAALRYRVVNAGNSGDTSSDGLDRVEQVIAMKPAIVIVEFGANDGLRGLPVASTRANLEQIIERLQKAGARIVLAGMTLPPNYGPDYIRSFEKIYPELAAKYKAALIPFLLEGWRETAGICSGTVCMPMWKATEEWRRT